MRTLAKADFVALASVAKLRPILNSALAAALKRNLPNFVTLEIGEARADEQALRLSVNIIISGAQGTAELAVVPVVRERLVFLIPIFVEAEGPIAALALAAVNSAVEPVKVPLEPLTVPPVDIDAALRAIPGLTPGVTKPIEFARVEIGSLAVSIEGDQLVVVGRLADSVPDALQVESTVAALKAAVETARSDLYGGNPPETAAAIALRKEAVARWLRPSLANYSFSATYALDTDLPKLEVKDIQPLNYKGIGCDLKTDQRACEPMRCDRHANDQRECGQPHDERNCSACLLKNPFGGCAVRGNDPICEAAKAGQNAAYSAAKANCEASKAAQNAAYEAQYQGCMADAARLKGQCEAEKAGQNAVYAAQKAACEAGKETVKRIQLIGPLGDFRADGHAGGSLTGSVDIASLSDDLVLTISTAMSGRVEIKGGLSFQPKNEGAVICVFPFSEPVLLAPIITGSGKAALQAVAAENGAALSLQGEDLVAHLEPSPIQEIVEAVFEKHPHVALNCPLPAAAAGLAGAMTAFDRNLFREAGTGDFKFSLPPLQLVLPALPVGWGGAALGSLRVTINGNSIVGVAQ